MVRLRSLFPLPPGYEAVLTGCTVNGEPVPFSQITEEHQEAMTPEEYTAYFEVLDARS